MSAARTAILDRVRAAQRTALIPGASDAGRVLSDPARSAAEPGAGRVLLDPAKLLAKFLAELTALGVDSYVEFSAADVRERLRAIVGGKSVLAWGAGELPYDAGSVTADAAIGASARDVQAAAEIGVTGCDAAIAETGSLVVLSGPGKPRTASLLPPIHACIVRRDDLQPSMGEFFARRADAIAAAACCTFITGPSRTADIELTLTLGVHGPGKVIVIVGP